MNLQTIMHYNAITDSSHEIVKKKDIIDWNSITGMCKLRRKQSNGGRKLLPGRKKASYFLDFPVNVSDLNLSYLL